MTLESLRSGRTGRRAAVALQAAAGRDLDAVTTFAGIVYVAFVVDTFSRSSPRPAASAAPG